MRKKDQKTTLVKKETTTRNWVLIDAKDQIVGRLASQVANILRGKNKPSFTPHVDNGDFVVVINAKDVQFTGRKMENKVYYHHTGYAGGIKGITAKDQNEKHPDRIIKDAVWGMLPKNRLSRQLLTKLKIYTDDNHPHSAQQPVVVTV